MQLRLAGPEDLDAIVALDRATDLAPHWPVAAYAAILDLNRAAALRCLFVAEQFGGECPGADATLAGFAVGLMHSAEEESGSCCTAELEDVVVAAGFRRAGIGRALCAAVLNWCRVQGATEVRLEVRAANVGAIALYTRLGFVAVGRRPRYYRDPEDDAVAMLLRGEL